MKTKELKSHIIRTAYAEYKMAHDMKDLGYNEYYEIHIHCWCELYDIIEKMGWEKDYTKFEKDMTNDR